MHARKPQPLAAPIPTPPLCAGRDPNKRLVSHMKFVMWTMSGDRGYNSTQMFNTMYANRTSAFWQQLGPAVVDNYYIRWVGAPPAQYSRAVWAYVAGTCAGNAAHRPGTYLYILCHTPALGRQSMTWGSSCHTSHS